MSCDPGLAHSWFTARSPQQVLRKLRKLPWADNEWYLVRALLSATRGRAGAAPLLASLAAGLSRCEARMSRILSTCARTGFNVQGIRGRLVASAIPWPGVLLQVPPVAGRAAAGRAAGGHPQRPGDPARRCKPLLMQAVLLPV